MWIYRILLFFDILFQKQKTKENPLLLLKTSWWWNQQFVSQIEQRQSWFTDRGNKELFCHWSWILSVFQKRHHSRWNWEWSLPDPSHDVPRTYGWITYRNLNFCSERIFVRNKSISGTQKWSKGETWFMYIGRAHKRFLVYFNQKAQWENKFLVNFRRNVQYVFLYSK